ncbi:MAG: type II secretion system protein GspM [Novosphingobium sp.]
MRPLDFGRFDPRQLRWAQLDLGRADPYWQQTRGWWIERSVREQLLLGLLSAAAILAALLLLVITPLRAERAEAMSRIRSAALIEARLRAGGADRALTGKVRRGSASAILTDSAAAARLTIERIEPEGGNTRVVISPAPFEQVLRWIADLEATSRLRVTEANFERKAPGIVAATLVLVG